MDLLDGIDLRTVLLLFGALGALAAAWYVARAAPRLVVAAWAAVCFLVPIWVGVQAGVYWSAVTAATIISLAAWTTVGLRFSYVDVLVVGFVVLVVAAYVVGGSTWGHLLIVFLGWLVPYAWGRVVLVRVDASWLYGCLAAVAIVAAVLGIVEFATGFNPFVGITMPNGAWRTWHDLQPRGGFIRAEGAFGHSIAFASALAMSSVFVLVAKWPAWVRIAGLVSIITAVGVSFSRIGLITLAISLVLGLLLLGRWVGRTMRLAVVVLLVAATAVIAPLIGDVFTAAGEEAGGSAEYRSDLASLIGDMRVLGITSGWTVLPTGETYYGTFQSIDSELVLTGLRFGSLPLLVVIAAIVACVLSLLRGRATPASVAVAAQVPAFATVALITQYGFLMWFLAGLAVTAYQAEELSDMKDPSDTLMAADSISQPGNVSSAPSGVPRERV
jgi:hypothetical protein